MHLAWPYLLQARFALDGSSYRYRRSDDPRRFVREQSRPVVGHGLLRPREADLKVVDAILYRFTSHHFRRTWQVKKIRPVNASEKPERTHEKYCMYDALGRGFGYTEAWVRYS